MKRCTLTYCTYVQGWELAHQFLERIAGFLWAKERKRDLLVFCERKSDSLVKKSKSLPSFFCHERQSERTKEPIPSPAYVLIKDPTVDEMKYSSPIYCDVQCTSTWYLWWSLMSCLINPLCTSRLNLYDEIEEFTVKLFSVQFSSAFFFSRKALDLCF